MTNAEAAAHFAALDPTGPAEILFVNDDCGHGEVVDLEAPQDADGIEKMIGHCFERNMLGKPIVVQKY